jgi:hypothetical protein
VNKNHFYEKSRDNFFDRKGKEDLEAPTRYSWISAGLLSSMVPSIFHLDPGSIYKPPNIKLFYDQSFRVDE